MAKQCGFRLRTGYNKKELYVKCQPYFVSACVECVVVRTNIPNKTNQFNLIDITIKFSFTNVKKGLGGLNLILAI